jgi:hypothetical protein
MIKDEHPDFETTDAEGTAQKIRQMNLNEDLRPKKRRERAKRRVKNG